MSQPSRDPVPAFDPRQARYLIFGKYCRLGSAITTGGAAVIEIEIQNETHQTQERLRFAAVPRIGEGIRLLEPTGFWVSYDVLDVWYQKAEYGDIWVPFLHVRITTGERESAASEGFAAPIEDDQVLSSVN